MTDSRHSQPNRGTLHEARQLEHQTLKLAEQGQLQQAVKACQQLNHRFPGFPSGWYTASQLAARLGNPAQALRAIENAIALQPTAPKWQLQKAQCLMQQGELDQARPLIDSLLTTPLGSAYQCASLGLLLSRLDRQEEALGQYQRAVELAPEVGEHYYNLASVHRFLGNTNAAEVALEQSISRSPQDFEAYKLRADLRTQTPEHNHVDALQLALAHFDDQPRAQVQLHYALAKELEDLSRWPESFEHLRAGANARRRLMRYSVDGDLETMEKIAEVYHPGLFEGHIAGCPDSQPIFIIGMPRTGTTLVERILGSHPDVHAAGELNNFALEMMNGVKRASPGAGRLSKIERVATSANIDFTQLGQDYLASTRPGTEGRMRFTDKLPLNFLYAGLIHLALPQAKIVHLVRHPLDSCYAIYKTLFADAYPFSYQQEELAHYYAGYHRLMAHWQQVMPGVIYDIHYEALVGDVEGNTRALLHHCDLPWNERCLAFHRNRAASTTASASQIRQPAHTRSVGKWRHFEQELQPLINTLEKEGIACAPGT